MASRRTSASRRAPPQPALVAARCWSRRARGQLLPAGSRSSRRWRSWSCSASSYLVAHRRRPTDGELLPSGQAAAMLVGHADPGDGAARAVRPPPRDPPRRDGDAPRGCTSGWCSSSRWSRRSRRCWWRCSPASCSSRASSSGSRTARAGMLENANKLARGYYEQNQRDVGNETRRDGRRHARLSCSQLPITEPRFRRAVLRFRSSSASSTKARSCSRRPTARCASRRSSIPSDGRSPKRVAAGRARRSSTAARPWSSRASADRIEAVTPIDRASRASILYTARNSDALGAQPVGARAERRRAPTTC